MAQSLGQKHTDIYTHKQKHKTGLCVPQTQLEIRGEKKKLGRVLEKDWSKSSVL